MPITSGLFFAFSANLLWALVFLAPLVLPDFSGVELAAGRNLAYGVVSVAILLSVQRDALHGLSRHDWLIAGALTVAGNLGYYLLLVWSIRLAGSAMPTLIIGLLPATLALAGNAVERSLPVRRLIPGAALLLAGLLLVNGVEAGRAGAGYLAGLGLALLAHLAWLAYGLANASYLKHHPERTPGSWATIVGVATLPLSAMLWLAAGAEGHAAGRDWTSFILVSLAFGILSSWLATWLWNRASAALPTALAAQLIVVETLGALAYAYGWEARWPEPPVALGTVLLLSGLVYTVRQFTRGIKKAPRTGRGRESGP